MIMQHVQRNLLSSVFPRMDGRTALLIQIFSILFLSASAQKFEPYELNGGLIAAVAAKDFVVIASDTRFMGQSGYDIVSREHISSRLWMAGDDTLPMTLLSSDGTLPETSLLTTTPQQQSSQQSSSSSSSPTRNVVQSFVTPKSPTFIGSAGCSTDCEALKRLIQADLRQAVYFAECAAHPHPPVDQVATLLSQVLFGRRSFPFYAFCIVAGLSHTHNNNNNSGGHVYVYDAIGSYEQVAVATSGTGRDLLQPILDGKFRTVAVAPSTTASSPQQNLMTKTMTVPTQVECTEEETITNLIEGYRSVSEREIGVGDNLVICVVRRQSGDGGNVECNVFSVPLKKH